MLTRSLFALAVAAALAGCTSSQDALEGTDMPGTVTVSESTGVETTTSMSAANNQPTVPSWSVPLDPADGPLLIVGDAPGELMRVPADPCDLDAYRGQEAHHQSWMDDHGRMLTIRTSVNATGELLSDELPPWTYELDERFGTNTFELRTADVQVFIGGDALDGDRMTVARAIQPRTDGRPGWAVPSDWNLRPVADGQDGSNCVVVDTVRVVEGLAPLEVRVYVDAARILVPPDDLLRSLLPEHDGVLVVGRDDYTEAMWRIGDSGYYAHLLARSAS